MENSLLRRKVPRGVSWPAAVMIRTEAAAEAAGVGFSDYVVDAVVARLEAENAGEGLPAAKSESEAADEST